MKNQSHENILIYDISYKTFIDSKPLRIRFDKINGIKRIHDGSRYLILFGTKNYDAIYDRIRYLLDFYKSKKWHHVIYFFSLFCRNILH